MDNIKIIYKNIKNIYLKVKPNCEVVLSVPKYTSSKEIEQILSKKDKWIKKHLQYFSQKSQDKTSLLYLGQRYKLKVIPSKIEKMILDKQYLILYVKIDDEITKQRLIDKWYRQQAKKIFNDILQKYLNILQTSINRLSIKKMKTRWGCCNYYKRYINLNLYLIRQDIKAIEYVILHELAHLTYPNHSKEFYNYIALYMPDWKARKKTLLTL